MSIPPEMEGGYPVTEEKQCRHPGPFRCGWCGEEIPELAPRAEGLDVHEAEYVDDGGDGYLACRCGYGHVIGDDALVDHIHDSRLAPQERRDG